MEEYASRDSNRGRERRPASLPRASPPHYFPSCRYVAGLNVPLAELQQGLKELVDDSAVLEGWEYLMPDEMSQAFWSTLAWPKRIDEQCKLVAEGNTALREEYAVAMQVTLLLPS